MTGAWSFRLGMAAVVLAAAAALAAGARAARVDVSAYQESRLDGAALPEPYPASRAPASASAREAAVMTNPFHPERRAGGRFRLPGDGTSPEREDPRPAERPLVVLVGTVVTPDGDDFVVCRIPGDLARVVRLGQMCGDLRLRSVRQGAADFQDPDGGRVVLEVPKEGSTR
jgi:hypothetical protein